MCGSIGTQEIRWSNFHLDFLFDAKEFLNCSLLSNAFVGLLEMVHTGWFRYFTLDFVQKYLLGAVNVTIYYNFSSLKVFQ